MTMSFGVFLNVFRHLGISLVEKQPIPAVGDSKTRLSVTISIMLYNAPNGHFTSYVEFSNK